MEEAGYGILRKGASKETDVRNGKGKRVAGKLAVAKVTADAVLQIQGTHAAVRKASGLLTVQIECAEGGKGVVKGQDDVIPLSQGKGEPFFQACLLASSAACGAGGDQNLFPAIRIRKHGKIKAVIFSEGKQRSVVCKGVEHGIKAHGKAFFVARDAVGQLQETAGRSSGQMQDGEILSEHILLFEESSAPVVAPDDSGKA